jgi:hypothetical protein
MRLIGFTMSVSSIAEGSLVIDPEGKEVLLSRI